MKLLPCPAAEPVVLGFSLTPPQQKWHQLNFRRLGEADIPLHVSLRAAEKVALISSLHNGVWTAPRAAPLLVDAASPMEVSLQLGPDGGSLQINGRRVTGLPGLPADQDGIIGLELSPDISLDSLTMNGGRPPPLIAPELKLGEDLMIYGLDLPPGALPSAPCLGVAGSDVSLPAALLPASEDRPGLSGLQVVFPGFLWTLPGMADCLRLKLPQAGTGADLPGLDLHRSDMLAAIEAFVRRCPDPLQARFEALTALEHVKYARLWPDLSREAAGFIRCATLAFKLEEFMELPLPDAVPEPEDVQPKADSVDQALGAEWREALLARLGATAPEEHPAVLRDLGSSFADLAENVRRGQLVALTEHFCATDRFEALAELATCTGTDVQAGVRRGDGWTASAMLPWLVIAQKYDAAAEVLQSLATRTNDWLNTSAIAWTLHAVLKSTQPALKMHQKEGVIYAFLALAEKMSEPYWGRGACVHMIAAAAELLAAATAFHGGLRHRIEVSVLRCHAFSPTFWQKLLQMPVDILSRSAVLAEGQAAFAVLQDSALARARGDRRDLMALRQAFRAFERAGAFGLSRMRVEVFGAAALGVADEHGPAGDSLSPDFAGDLLRAAAFPNAPPLPEALRLPAKEALAGLCCHEHRSESHDQRIALTRLSLQLLKSSGDDPDEGRGMLAEFRSRLLSLPEAQSPGLRLGMALLIYCDALRVGHQALRKALEPLISAFLAENPPLSADDPVLLAVARRLAECAPTAQGEPACRAILSRLRQIVRTGTKQEGDCSAESRKKWLQSPALFDTLVLIYSCKANLDSRVARIRETWAKDLDALGIPWLVVTGEGDDSTEGDILRLNVDDSYEFLPRKTLSMLQWAARNTPFSHILKIDDDCYLDVESYFFSLSHRFHDYHGRIIRRNPGDKPPAWHMGRSASLRARMELDKSPEPSAYADGGSAYALSRRSCFAVTAQVGTYQGQRLCSVSYSEDKLVGDLLALAGITPQQTDCATIQMRRVHPDGVPVVRWSPGFFPSEMSVTKVAHLDVFDGFHRIRGDFRSGRLRPSMIWPANRSVGLETSSPHLIQVSPDDRVQAALTAEISVIAAVRNEKFILGHFLNHYRSLGVSSFIFADNMSDDGTLEFLLDQPDTLVFSAEAPYRSTAQGTEWKIALMAQLRPGKWSLVADADEMLLYPGYEQTGIVDFLKRGDLSGYDAFRIGMLDLYPKGRLQDADLSQSEPFSQIAFADRCAFRQTPTLSGNFGRGSAPTSALRHRILPGSPPGYFVAEKIALLRYQPWMRLSVGLHYATEINPAPGPLLFAHFKYHSEFFDRARREAKRGQYFNGAQEYKRYLALLSEARDVLYDDTVSVPWRQCDLACEVLGPTES